MSSPGVDAPDFVVWIIAGLLLLLILAPVIRRLLRWLRPGGLPGKVVAFTVRADGHKPRSSKDPATRSA